MLMGILAKCGLSFQIFLRALISFIVQREMYAIFLFHISHWNTGTYNNHRTIQIAKVICFSEAVGPVTPERPNCVTSNWPSWP